MNELEFRKWLNKKGVSKKMQSDHTSRIKRIEKEINHCDIDNEYHNDKCITLLAYFEKNGCNNQMDKIKNCDLPIGKLINHFSKTTFGNMDFYDFMNKYEPEKNDFIFVDPPYDSEFSTYSKNEFVESDQERLANYLINNCKGNFMLVIKNTDLISSLYVQGTKTANKDKIYISSFDKNYSVSFKNRNNKKVQHLVITNYPT